MKNYLMKETGVGWPKNDNILSNKLNKLEFEEVSNWDYIELKIMYNFDIYLLIDYIMQDAPVGCAIKRSNI